MSPFISIRSKRSVFLAFALLIPAGVASVAGALVEIDLQSSEVSDRRSVWKDAGFNSYGARIPVQIDRQLVLEATGTGPDGRVHLVKKPVREGEFDFFERPLEIALDGIALHRKPESLSSGHRLWTGFGLATNPYQMAPLSQNSQGVFLVLEAARFGDGGLRHRVLLHVRGKNPSIVEFMIAPNYPHLPVGCRLQVNATGWVLDIQGAEFSHGGTRENGLHGLSRSSVDSRAYAFGLGVYNDREVSEPAKFSLFGVTVRDPESRASSK